MKCYFDMIPKVAAGEPVARATPDDMESLRMTSVRWPVKSYNIPGSEMW